MNDPFSRFERLAEVANEGLATSTEVTAIAVQIIQAVQQAISGFLDQLTAVGDKAQKGIDGLDTRVNTIEDELGRIPGEIRQEIEDKIAAVELLEGPKGDQGDAADDEVIARRVYEMMPPPKQGSPDTGIQVRDKLESLKPGQRLDAEFIDGLKELISKLLPKDNGGVRVIGGRAGIQMYIDGVKVGLVQTLNLLAGTGITFSSLNKNGVLTLTVNSSGAAAGTWYLGEQITLDVDAVTFHLLHAPTAKLEVLLDRQPQIMGVDISGTIDGVNKDFAFTSAVDPSLFALIYANYL